MFCNKYLPFMESLTCALRAQVSMTQTIWEMLTCALRAHIIN